MNFFLSSYWSIRLTPVIIALLALITLASRWWLPYSPRTINLPSRLLSPGAQRWLGTDHLGRDIFSRLMVATRMSLGSVMAYPLLILTLGLVIGDSAGLTSRRIDQATMRVADMFVTFPTSILSFFTVGVLGTGLTDIIIAIALSHWAWYARMVCSLVASLRQREFALASWLSGAGHVWVLVDHLTGAVIPSLLVLVALGIGHVMLRVVGMSFLDLDMTTLTAEWDVMINNACQYIWTQPLQMFWLGLALSINMMTSNLVGDALYGHLDPHLVMRHAH